MGCEVFHTLYRRKHFGSSTSSKYGWLSALSADILLAGSYANICYKVMMIEQSEYICETTHFQ